jgi:hypothetical protein
MAKYVVMYKGKLLANAELYTECLVKGERTLIRMLGLGTVRGVKIFDEVLYTVAEKDRAKALNACDEIQDVDAALLYSMKVGNRKIRDRITITHGVETYTDQVKGLRYIKVRSFDKQNKYRLLARLPVVEVCGTKYVALDAYNGLYVDKDGNEPIIVSLDAAQRG